MKATNVRRFVFLASLCLLATGVAEAQRSGNVSGRVVDEDGEPIQGVLVTLLSEEEERTDETNKKGRFTLVVLDATQRFMIRLEKDGYVPIQQPLEVRVGQTVNEVFTLTEVEGRVDEVTGNSEAIEAYNAGATAYNAGDYDTARERFEAALGIDPELLEARKVVTLVYFQQRDWEAAVASAEIVAEAEPDNVAALKVGFDASGQLGDRERAAGFLDRMVALDPSPDTARRVFNYGVGELQEGNRDAALALFEQAIEIDPTLGSAYHGVATIHLDEGAFEEALAAADRLLAVDPGNAEGLGIRYEAYRRMGDEENMRAALEELQSADPERIVEAFYQQGMLLFNEGNAQAAVEAFERVLTADPGHPRAHYQLGRAYLGAGDYEKGKEYLLRFIEMAPDDPEVAAAKEMLAYLD